MRLVGLCWGLLCVLLSTAPAWAEPSEADRATARALALEGHNALKNKDYAGAADRFGRADALVHAPTLVVDWARALQGLGRYVEAHEKYELVLREGVDSTAPKSWQRALEEAKKELEALKPRLGWVTVVLKEPTDASVSIDGVLVPPAAVGVKRAADPGFPEVVVIAPGYARFKQTLTVGPGEEKTIEVSLRKLAMPAASPPPADAAYRPRQKTDLRRTLSYVALGVGGVGLATWGTTGILFLNKRSQLKDACMGTKCPPTDQTQTRLDRQNLYGTLAAVSFGVGLAGVGTGVALLLTEPKSRETPSAKLTVRPLIGLGAIGAEGSFQ